MQQTRLPHSRESIPSKVMEKERRFLRPSPFKYQGRRLYSNELGQDFFSRVKLDGKAGNYSIEVFQLGEGEPIARFVASAQLMGKAFMVKFMTRTSWGALRKYSGVAPTGYCAARLVVNEAISLAQKLGAKTICLEAANFRLFAHYRSLGFSEIPNTNYMQLEVAYGAKNP